MAVYVKSCTYRDADHGIVHVRVLRTARRFTLHLRDGEYFITIPQGTTPEEFHAVLGKLVGQLGGPRNPGIRFSRGQVLEFPFWRVLIADGGETEDIIIKAGIREATIEVGRGVDLETEEASRRVSRCLVRAAAFAGIRPMEDFLREVSGRLGVAPTRWESAKGFRTLGRCYGDGRIKISSALLFLPRELAEYIVAHELAHLTHMDHSPRFHALLDSYLGGRERELKRAVDRFAWPLYR